MRVYFSYVRHFLLLDVFLPTFFFISQKKKILVGIPEGKRARGRRRRKWEDNITIDLWEIGWENVDWVHLAQDRDKWRAFVNLETNLWVP
jgi:hypothetical protein